MHFAQHAEHKVQCRNLEIKRYVIIISETSARAD